MSTQLKASVINGMSLPCTATLNTERIMGIVVRDLILTIISSPQPTPEQQHAALVISKRLADPTPLDISVLRGQNGQTEIGDTTKLNEASDDVGLNDIVIDNNVQSPIPESLTITISDSYRAG